MLNFRHIYLLGHRTISGLLLALLLFPALLSAREPFEIAEPPSKTFDLWVKPKKSTPAEQYTYAKGLAENGKQKSAIRQLRYLVLKWPEAPEAPVAQLHRAQLLHARKEYREAFDEYQYLVNKYAGQFPYDEVLTSQFEIARIMESSRSRFLGIPAAKTPEQAVPLYTSIVANAPQWKHAAEAQYRIGKIHHDNLKLEDAIIAYEATIANHSGSEFERHATFGKALCLEKLAQETPYDEAASETAWAGYNTFLDKFPTSEQSKVALEKCTEIRNRLAEMQYNTAVFYDKTQKNPRAARIAYQTLLKEFPTSPWTETAKIRIEQLSKASNNSSDQ